VLTTPGLLAQGWRLPGVDEAQRLAWPGLTARLACAAVARADVVSGWDLAGRQPKPAERVAPAGSVYWLDDLDTTPEALGKLAEQGLWFDAEHNAQRRAEGFNRFTFAAW
jgi:CRISPR-associated protein Cmr3